MGVYFKNTGGTASFTIPQGASDFIAILIGAGCGGNGTVANGRGGGGGGSITVYRKADISGLTFSGGFATIDVVVGTGSAGGVAAAASNPGFTTNILDNATAGTVINALANFGVAGSGTSGGAGGAAVAVAGNVIASAAGGTGGNGAGALNAGGSGGCGCGR